MDQVVHFINQANNTVKVKINAELTDAKVTVVSAGGQVVQTGAVDFNEFIVDMNGLSAGIYMINVSANEGTITKKMIVH